MTMQLRKSIGTIVLVSALLALPSLTGCIIDERAWTRTDTWYSPRPVDVGASEVWSDVPSGKVHEVTPGKRAEAESLLKDVSVYQVTARRASQLTGRSLPARTDSVYCLTRAVYLNRGTGRFSVMKSGPAIRVGHGSLGARPVPMKRQALVIELDELPKVLYVDCSMCQ
ncbi:hypothetical protein LCGC14_2259630 [marine sediment metagenome]|uniref:Lipoprotein n=1 Tax=marine sediment metagenome TaxID=412755 RepID=A0A0F9FCG9_9ZZZZ